MKIRIPNYLFSVISSKSSKKEEQIKETETEFVILDETEIKIMEEKQEELSSYNSDDANVSKITEATNDKTECTKCNVEKWHEQINDLNKSLLLLQPDVSKILETLMKFTSSTTDSYVLQFAKQQIELYDLIFDNYCYHKGAIVDTDNKNYSNAIYNYEEFMQTIVENLAIFGIEEIVSEKGASVSGQIHDTGNAMFSKRTAYVESSIRSGFRYKDIILQKEKISVGEIENENRN